MRRITHEIMYAFAAVALLSGCVTMDSVRSFNILSTQEEVAIGREVANEIEAQEKVLDDPALQQYINEIGQRLLIGVERRDVEYQFKVIDAPDTVNAFALPGGFMYVYTGLIKFCENEAELASVMAHEIAHVSAHHHGEALTRAYGYQLALSIILGNNQAQAGRIAGEFIGGMGMMYFSRQNEYEADAKGMEYLAQAGYQPGAMVSFMQKLGQASQSGSGGGSRLITLFATHPPTSERVSRLSVQEQQYPVDLRTNGLLHPERYQEKAVRRIR